MSSRRMYEPDWARYKDQIVSMANKRYPLSKISRYLYKKKRFFPSYRQLETAVKRWEADGLIQNYESDASAEDFRDNYNQPQVPTGLESRGASQDQVSQASAGDGTTDVDQRFHNNGPQGASENQAISTSAGDGTMDVDQLFHDDRSSLFLMSSHSYTATTTAQYSNSQPLHNEFDNSTIIPQTQNGTFEVPQLGLGTTPCTPVDGPFEQGIGVSFFYSDELWNDTYGLDGGLYYAEGEDYTFSGSAPSGS